MFITVWAFFFIRSIETLKNERVSFIKIRFVHLLLVFLFWSTIYFLIIANWDELTIRKVVTKHWSGFGWSGQYFFIVLFQLALLFPLLRWIYKRYYLRNVTLILCVSIYIWQGYFGNFIPDIVWKLGNRMFVYWIPYVFLACYIYDNNLKKMSRWWCLAPVLIPFEFWLLEANESRHSSYITPMVLLTSSIFVLCIFQFDQQKYPNPARKLVSFLGSNTMTVFVANPLVIIVLSEIITPISLAPDHPLKIPALICLPVLSTLIVFTLCILLAWAISKTPLQGKVN